MTIFLSRKNKVDQHIFYASGNSGKSIIASFLEFFALFYFTDILGLPASVAGSIILLSLIWDGITDPIMGLAADRFRHRFQTVMPYFLVGVPLTALAVIGLFQTIHISDPYQVPYIFVTLITFRTAYTIVDVPHNSLLSFLTHDSKQRTNIASIRVFFSALGRLFVTLTSIYILSETASRNIELRFSDVAFIFAFIYLLIMSVCLYKIKNVPLYHAEENLDHFLITDAISNILSNKKLLIVFMLTAITSLTTHVIGSALIYYGKYAFEQKSIGGTALIIMASAQALSLIFWSRLSNYFTGKPTASQYANMILCISTIVAISILNTAIIFFIIAGLIGFAQGGIFMLNWSLLPDALDQENKHSPRRYDLTAFGLYSLINKVCHGLSQAYLGWILAFYDYTPNSIIAKENIHEIINFIFTAPLFGSIACIYLLHKYKTLQKEQNHKSGLTPY